MYIVYMPDYSEIENKLYYSLNRKLNESGNLVGLIMYLYHEMQIDLTSKVLIQRIIPKIEN